MGKLKAGKVQIDFGFLLNWLQFPNAQILAVESDINNKILTLTIADDEMPEVRGLGDLKTVTPHYITYQDFNGHRVVIRQPIENGIIIEKEGVRWKG